MEHGWFKLDRDIFQDKLLTRDADHLAVWCYLCANAAFKARSVVFSGKPVTLQPGQLITGRKVIAQATGVNEYKVQRILSLFESAQRIAQQTGSQNRLITMLSADEARKDAQQNAHLVHNGCTTDAQQIHTIKKEKKERQKDVNTSALARRYAGKEKWKQGQESVYSSDRSYDLDTIMRESLEKLMRYEPKDSNI